jgi:hypothetical protein
MGVFGLKRLIFIRERKIFGTKFKKCIFDQKQKRMVGCSLEI